MKTTILIVAGGAGKRMHSSVPKQFLKLGGKPILMHTFEQFMKVSDDFEYVLVLPENHLNYWRELIDEHQFSLTHQVVPGGAQRFFSVKNGLETVDHDGIVAIHDGVRPLVSPEMIKRCLSVAMDKGNAVPVVPVKDSVRKKAEDGSIVVDRQDLYLVQTPQCFHANIIRKAYDIEHFDGITDDAMVVEQLGEKINLVDGNEENMKITSRLDLKMAGLVLENNG